MTIPEERTRAVLKMAKVVMELAPYLRSNSETVKVPAKLIQQLHALLRHYPTASEMDLSAQICPEFWATTGERIRLPMRFVVEYAQADKS